MAIVTTDTSSITITLPTEDEKSFITGQTKNTSDFTSGLGSSGYNNKIDISTSRSVDGTVTGANWASYWFKSHGTYADDNHSGGITIEDLLPHNKEMEISGYFFRGKTALEADLGGGSYEVNNENDFSFDIVFEDDSTQFANFTNNGNKTRLDYIPPYDGSNQSTNTTTYSKWSYHVGKGVLPTYNGSNVGVKGGWLYSGGRSDSSFVQCSNSNGTSLQRDGRLYSVNFDTVGSGLTRFFKIYVVNKSGVSVKLKLLFRNNGSSSKFFGLYDFRTRIYTGYHTGAGDVPIQSGILYGPKKYLAISKSGLVGSHVYDTAARMHNLKTSQSNTLGHVAESDFVIDIGQVRASSYYEIEYPVNYENGAATGLYAIPLASLEDYHEAVATGDGVLIGGNPSDWHNSDTGSHVLGPMPVAGKILSFKMKFSNSLAYNSSTLNIYKVDFGGINVGDLWTGGAGVQTLVSSMAATAPSSGSDRYKEWTGINQTFAADDCIIMALNITAAHGNIAGVVLIEYDLDALD